MTEQDFQKLKRNIMEIINEEEPQIVLDALNDGELLGRIATDLNISASQDSDFQEAIDDLFHQYKRTQLKRRGKK